MTVVIEVDDEPVPLSSTLPYSASISIQGQFLGSYVLHPDDEGRGSFQLSESAIYDDATNDFVKDELRFKRFTPGM